MTTTSMHAGPHGWSGVVIRASIIIGCKLAKYNAEVAERGEEREEKRVVSFQTAWAQEHRKSVRETSGPYIF